mgnify:CR=1 FL=1
MIFCAGKGLVFQLQTMQKRKWWHIPFHIRSMKSKFPLSVKLSFQILCNGRYSTMRWTKVDVVYVVRSFLNLTRSSSRVRLMNMPQESSSENISRVKLVSYIHTFGNYLQLATIPHRRDPIPWAELCKNWTDPISIYLAVYEYKAILFW